MDGDQDNHFVLEPRGSTLLKNLTSYEWRAHNGIDITDIFSKKIKIKQSGETVFDGDGMPLLGERASFNVRQIDNITKEHIAEIKFILKNSAYYTLIKEHPEHGGSYDSTQSDRKSNNLLIRISSGLDNPTDVEIYDLDDSSGDSKTLSGQTNINFFGHMEIFSS